MSGFFDAVTGKQGCAAPFSDSQLLRVAGGQSQILYTADHLEREQECDRCRDRGSFGRTKWKRLKGAGIQVVAVTLNADNPGEAALLRLVVKGNKPDTIPAVQRVGRELLSADVSPDANPVSHHHSG
jgi:hypothetical protein